jgi:DNA-directed RNA polymerase subunit H
MSSDITKHHLVPKHTKLNDSEKDKLLQELNINSAQLPKIIAEDPAIVHLGIKAGDVIKIERESKTAGISIYYRVVIDA